MSGRDRHRQTGRWTGPRGAACVVVDEVRAPAWVVPEFPPGWELLGRCRLCDWRGCCRGRGRGRGSRLFRRGVLRECDGFGWMWATLIGGDFGMACGQGRK